MKSIILTLAAAAMLATAAHAETLDERLQQMADFMATVAVLQGEVVKAQAETQAARDAIATGDMTGACRHLHAAYNGMDGIIVLSDTYAAQLNAHDEYAAADRQKLRDEVSAIRGNVVIAQGTVAADLKSRCPDDSQ